MVLIFNEQIDIFFEFSFVNIHLVLIYTEV